MRTLYISGGLGNQLHQLSLAIALAEKFPLVVSTALVKSFDRKFEAAAAFNWVGLHETANRCRCGREPAIIDVTAVGMDDLPCCFVSHPGDAPWMAHHTVPDTMRAAIRSMLVGLAGGKSDLSDAVAIHFRLGDYLWPPAAARYGVLGSQYYETGVVFSGGAAKYVAFTDDTKALFRLHRKFSSQYGLIASPVRPVLEDFAAMVGAKRFIAANSTLSLWVKWYRDQDRDVSPTRAYRETEGRALPGLGHASPSFWHPIALVAAHPWVLSRRLRWQEKYWI